MQISASIFCPGAALALVTPALVPTQYATGQYPFHNDTLDIDGIKD